MAYHAGRYLRIAPEHTEDSIHLKLMGKPGFEAFESFVRLFNSINLKVKERKVNWHPT
jgi:hypothetical protein